VPANAWSPVFIVFSAAPVRANSLLNESDVSAVSQLNSAVLDFVRDMVDSTKNVSGYGVDKACMESLMNNSERLSAETSTLSLTTNLLSVIIDPDKEWRAVQTGRIFVDYVLNRLDGMRSSINRLAGQCSRFPVPVAKSQQLLQLVHRSETVVKSIVSRLPSPR
jgi:hypothetical protein